MKILKLSPIFGNQFDVLLPQYDKTPQCHIENHTLRSFVRSLPFQSQQLLFLAAEKYWRPIIENQIFLEYLFTISPFVGSLGPSKHSLFSTPQRSTK